MISNKYIAIDFGTSHISAMAAEIDSNDKIRVLAYEPKISDDVKHGIVEQVSGAAFKVNELIKLLQNSAKINDIDQVAISIGAKGMKHVHVSVNRFVGAAKVVSEELISDMMEECIGKVKRQDINVFDTIPLSYELDGIKMDEPVGKNGVQITGHYSVIYGNKLISDKIASCFDRTGIRLEYSPVSSECLSAVVLSEEDKDDGCALISLGASTTTLSIYQNGALQQMLLIPLGGKNITLDIQELGISQADAEKLKRVKGSALESSVTEPVLIQVQNVDPDSLPVKISTAFLAKIIEARLEEILLPILETIDNYPLPLKAGIILTGGAAKLNNIDEFIYQRTGMNVQISNHADALTNDTNDQFLDPAFAQIIGTIKLTKEYRKENETKEPPVVKQKDKPKLPRSLKEKVSIRILNFFSDDTDMQEDKNKNDQKQK
jgi:cell division protein FtsA